MPQPEQELDQIATQESFFNEEDMAGPDNVDQADVEAEVTTEVGQPENETASDGEEGTENKVHSDRA